MKHLAIFALASAFVAYQPVAASASDPLCKPLQAFVASVSRGATREAVFYTSWGRGFKGDSDASLYAKRCSHAGYAPAKAVCAALMDSGSVEFPGNNVKRALSCLSATRFAERMQLDRGDFRFSYGTENRGENVEISLGEDSSLGAMALRITADGY